MPSQRTATRIFGLDVLRAIGGLMVVVAHTGHLVADHWPRFPPVPHIDWLAVFFVLSGFLIGNILLDALALPGPPLLRLLDFLQRRWLRTLPNYYLFLLLNILLVAFGLAPGMLSRATAAYAVFMQNFHLPLDLFFWESWSLAVEEWFYLLFPLLAFGLMALPSLRGSTSFLWVCLLFILFPVAARMGVAHHVVDESTRNIWVQKLVITRLDAPGYGMLAAWVARHHRVFWRLLRWPALACGIGLLLFLATLARPAGPGALLYGMNSLEAFATALLLPLFSQWNNGGAWAGTFRLLSLTTYSLYLVHMPMLYLLGRYVPGPVAWSCAARYGLFLAGAWSVAALVYVAWERRFMRMRDPAGRWLARRFAAPVQAVRPSSTPRP